MPEKFFEGKKVAVTGAAGTVGREIVAQVLKTGALHVRALDSNENNLHRLDCEYASEKKLETFYCDIRNPSHLNEVFEDVDCVFHAAALKHVPSCERSPCEAIQTNILGIQNIIRAARANKVGKVIFTSSDKAVNPTSVMGTSKLMGEKLITAAHTHLNGTLFASTRFGNVLGSEGSVVPIFCRQIAQGGPVTVTDDAMTRFVMDLPEAVGLVINSMSIARGGEVFVTKMPVITIQMLAEVMIELIAPLYGHNPANIEIAHVGARPGEKIYEELTSSEELRRTLELDNYFAVLPALGDVYKKTAYNYPGYHARPAERIYISSNEPLMTRAELKAFLLRPKVLPVEIRERLDDSAAQASPSLRVAAA